MRELRRLLQGSWARVGLSLLMALVESFGWVLIPFVIGLAIDDYLAGSNTGLILLVIVGVTTTLLAVVRRLHDTRLYARIYEQTGADPCYLSERLSTKTARLNMLREANDFLEHSIPLFIESTVILIGSLIFLATLKLNVFLGALVVTALIAVIYATSTRRTLRFNKDYNDEYERQVDVLDENDVELTRHHIKLLNRWTIKLSDINAVNFGLSFTMAIGLLVFAIVSAASSGVPYGALLSIVLYVLEFAWTASAVPNTWQESLRLRDILKRLRLMADDE